MKCCKVIELIQNHNLSSIIQISSVIDKYLLNNKKRSLLIKYIIDLYNKDPTYKDFLSKLAFLSAVLQDDRLAETLWQQDISMNRASWRAQIVYAGFLATKNRVNEAIKLIRKIYKNYNEACGGYTTIAWRIRYNNFRKANQLYKLDLETNRIDPFILGKWIPFLVFKKKFREASKLLTKFHNTFSNIESVYHEMTQMYQVQEKWDKIVELYENAPFDNWFQSNKKPKKSSDKTLYAFYDLQVSPPTFDIISFLGHCESYRLKMRLEKIYLIIVPATPTYYTPWYPLDYSSQMRRLYNIVLGTVRCLPSIDGFMICRDRDMALDIFRNKNYIFPLAYSPKRPIADFYFYSNALKKFSTLFVKPPNDAIIRVKNRLAIIAKGKKVITITIRKAPIIEVQRNSNIENWVKATSVLDSKEFCTIILDDYDHIGINKYPKHIHTFEEAIVDVSIRSALYQEADINIGTGSGTLMLCLFNPASKFLMFQKNVAVHTNMLTHLNTNSKKSDFYKAFLLGKTRKIIPKEDSVKNIINELKNTLKYL